MPIEPDVKHERRRGQENGGGEHHPDLYESTQSAFRDRPATTDT